MEDYDLFISHANEDKDAFVRPLAHRLVRSGFKIWYDEFSLRLGDSLRRSIELGISRSRFGVVVLSPNFFSKNWPQLELDALTSLDVDSKCKILPIWLSIDKEQILKYSPLLADKIASKASEGMDDVIKRITEVVKPDLLFSDIAIQNLVNRFRVAKHHEIRFLYLKAFCRLEALLSYDQDLSRYLASEDESRDNEVKFHSYLESLNTKYEIPDLIYQDDLSLLKRYEVHKLSSTLKKWFHGKLGAELSYELFFLLNEFHDLDYLYILFGIPNFSVSSKQQGFLDSAIIEIGSRASPNRVLNEEKAYQKVLQKYYSLRA